jgi:DNA-binding response OmpR family regulator
MATEAAESGEVLLAGELEVRPGGGLAVAGGRVLTLSVREFELLVALLRRQNRIVARVELHETVWGTPLRDGDRSVDVYIHKLRAKLEAALPAWSFIHTHVGFGYRLCPEHRDAFTSLSQGDHDSITAAAAGPARLSPPT